MAPITHGVAVGATLTGLAIGLAIGGAMALAVHGAKAMGGRK